MSNPTEKDANQTLRYAFDDATNSFRTTATFAGTISVELDATTDSVAIGDGTNTLAINPDGSINIVGDIPVTNPANRNTGSAVPVQATQVAGSDGVNLRALKVSSSGILSVDGSASTQPVSVIALPLPSGAATSANQSTANTSLATIASNTTNAGTPVVSGSVSVTNFPATQPVSAVSLPLPSGASTAANQSTEIAALGTINTTLGSPIQQTGGTITANAGTGTFAVSAASLPLPTGAATSTLQGTANSSLATIATNTTNAGTPVVSGTVTANAGSGTFNVGQATGTNLHTVVDNFPATQPISAASLPLPTNASTSALQTTGNTSLASIDTKTPTVGQKVMASSSPVVIASDQSAIAVSGTVTANQGTANTAANAWPHKITDGTNTAAVKAASTASVATDPALVVAVSPNNTISTTLGSASTGIKANVSLLGALNTSIDPNLAFNDPFDAGVIDTTNRWNAPVVSGGGAVTQGSVAGLVISTGTSANAAAQLTSQPSFNLGSGVGQTFAFGLKVETTAATGNYRFFGFASQGTSYSTTNPIKDGIGFDITTAGVLRAVIYASDALIFSQALTIPTDGAEHIYLIINHGPFFEWYLDSFGIPAATSSVPSIVPDISTLSLRFASLNGSSPTVGTPTISLYGVTIEDNARQATHISDGTYPWRRAQVSTAGALLVSSAQLPTALGTQTIVNSTAVNIASDQVVNIFGPDVYITGQSAQTATVNNILTASAGAAANDLAGYRSGSVQVVSTGTAGTFIFEGSNDNVSFQTIPVYSQLVLTGAAVSASITATSSSLIYTFPVSVRYLRLRIATTITGGSIQAFSRFSQETWVPAVFEVAQNTAGNLLTTATIGSGTVTTVSTVTASNIAKPTLVADVASAALTVTTTTGTLTPTSGCSYQVTIPVTVVSGTTPTLDVQVQESDDSGTNWKAIYDFPRITATGFYRSPVFPLTGDRVRYVQTVTGTTPSFTRAINRLQSSSSSSIFRQLIDRTIDPNTLNSVTPNLTMSNAHFAQILFDLSAVTIAPVIQLEGSDDNGGTWYAIGNTLTGVASSTVSLTVPNVNSALIRARISTGGTGVTLNYVLLKAF